MVRKRFQAVGIRPRKREELPRLKRELERRQKERDLFKKAVAIFSQNQGGDLSSSKIIGRNIR
jgi:hypothetical protein